MQVLFTEQIHFKTNDILHLVFQIRFLKSNSSYNLLHDKKNYRRKLYKPDNNFEPIKCKQKGKGKLLFIYKIKENIYQLNRIINLSEKKNLKILLHTVSIKKWTFLILIFDNHLRNFFFGTLKKFSFIKNRNVVVSVLKKDIKLYIKTIFKIGFKKKINHYGDKINNFVVNFFPEMLLWIYILKKNKKFKVSIEFKNSIHLFTLVFCFIQKSKYLLKKIKINNNVSNNYFLFFKSKVLNLDPKKEHSNDKTKINNGKILLVEKFEIDSNVKFYFYFYFWKIKWEKEFCFFKRILRNKKWEFKKSKFIFDYLILRPTHNSEKLICFSEKFFFFIITKFRNVVQEYPHSLILKARLLVKNLFFKNSDKKDLIIRSWVKDIQNSLHFNLLSFLILFFDLIFSSPKLKNIFPLTSILMKGKFFRVDNLYKAPQTLEKFLSLKLPSFTNSPKIVFNFIIKNGLIDFFRKFISKSMLYSSFKNQKILYKQWMDIDMENITLHTLAKFTILNEKLNNKITDMESILTLLYRNGRWAYIYNVFCKKYHSSRNYCFIRLAHKKNLTQCIL